MSLARIFPYNLHETSGGGDVDIEIYNRDNSLPFSSNLPRKLFQPPTSRIRDGFLDAGQSDCGPQLRRVKGPDHLDPALRVVGDHVIYTETSRRGF